MDMLQKKEMDILRTLAQKYADIAALPVHAEKRALWIKLNTIHMERPMLLCDQLPWNELDVDGFLVCHVEDPYWRGVEQELRRTIYKWEHLPADMVFNPYICLPRPMHSTEWGIQCEHVAHIILEEGATASSGEFVNQIQCMDDLEKVKMPKITLDREKEAEIVREAKEMFTGIIDFRMTGEVLHMGVWDRVSRWMEVENCYIEIMDRPEMMHALMEKLTQGLISKIQQMNEMELFDIHSNLCHCSHSFLPDMPKEEDRALSGNSWGMGLAQLFTSVSPQVVKEFEVDYMKRVFPYFGAIYYGCCDQLDNKMDVVRTLPKIRKLSCSPWSDREHFAEVMPDYCVMSNKPNPAFLAMDSLDEQAIRDDIRRTMDAAKEYNRSLEFILKDVSTVKHEPQRLWRWQEIVMDEIQR